MAWAIACMSGGFKGIFVHGVLCGLEETGLRASAYAAASSSTLAAAYAACGGVRRMDLGIWTESERILRQPGSTMSDVVLHNIRTLGPSLHNLLFAPKAARFCVAASLVTTAEAAALTQGVEARRLGRRLLIEAARQNALWRDTHLAARLFDSRTSDGGRRLSADNFDEVAYATTRMLHAWHIPATVAGQPYIDASYTCLCPTLEMAELGYTEVIAIGTERGPLRRDLFSAEPLPSQWKGARIDVIQPEYNLEDVGVDFTRATSSGLAQVFEQAVRRGREFGLRRRDLAR
jgi:hypothetical protein